MQLHTGFSELTGTMPESSRPRSLLLAVLGLGTGLVLLLASMVGGAVGPATGDLLGPRGGADLSFCQVRWRAFSGQECVGELVARRAFLRRMRLIRVFGVRGRYEVVLEGVELRSAEGFSPLCPASGLEPFSSGEGAGMGSRVVLEGFGATLGREPNPIRLVAVRGVLEEGGLRFEDATLSWPHLGRAILSPTILWEESRRELVVPGWYRLDSLEGGRLGRGLRVRLPAPGRPTQAWEGGP